MANAHLPDEFYDLVCHHLPPEQPVGPKGGSWRRLRASGERWEASDAPGNGGPSSRTSLSSWPLWPTKFLAQEKNAIFELGQGERQFSAADYWRVSQDAISCSREEGLFIPFEEVGFWRQELQRRTAELAKPDII